MSAIIITQAAQPGERTRLIQSRQLSSSNNHKSYSTYSSSNSEGESDDETHRNTTSNSNQTTPSGSTYLGLRSAPLRHSISKTRFIVICAGIWSANFVFAFQSTAIPTLAPSIGSGFNHAELASYLPSVFSLANAAVIPVYGVLMEVLGRKMAMVTACLFFGLGTIGCALSKDMYTLIGARAVAGLGGGGLLTVSSVIVTDLVALRDRGVYQGIMMTIFGAGSMCGGPVSGWLADKYGWEVSFWVQIPVVIFCATIVSIFLPQAPIPPTHKSLLKGLRSLDWTGTILLIGSTTTLILGFSFHTSYLYPWTSPIVWGNLVAAITGAGLLLLVESRIKNPLIALELFRDRHTASIMASGFFLSVVAQAFMYQVPVYFVVILNTTSAQAGLLPSVGGGIGLAIGSMLAGSYIRRGGKYKLLGILSLFPSVLCGLAASTWKPSWKWWEYYVSSLPAPLGYSIFLCVNLVGLISAVDSKMMPKATALLYTTRTLGGTLGVALGSSVQIGVLASSLKAKLVGIPARDEIINSILHSKAAIRLLPPDLEVLALESYAHSLSVVWFLCGCVGCLTILSACFMDEKDLTHDPEVSKAVEGTGGGSAEGGFGEGLGVSVAGGVGEVDSPGRR